ncbi:PTS sugar transporter subunit IIA [Parasulfitobacter algicola]|uniref:PTS sugar transporter subunit IIA n=1 Tax=Parasulfitobacter algicola TaxID=2614809 RepID=A0ABX2ILB4_9RHOB|nr:PTS sugar transporter subunit IIA [Sulfitobacter algicola]NSX53355.1 PTS sugar transporter subunit IIA [Sulfitobacter algicola]
MEISSLLNPNAVKLVNQASSKRRLFRDLGDVAENVYGLCAPHILDALLDRESLGPTGVGHGVALPHARIEEIDHVAAVFLKLEKPMDFDAVDRQPVDLVFALFAPQQAGVEHLKALALVSRTMRDTSICAKLRANHDPAILHAVLTEGPASQAA